MPTMHTTAHFEMSLPGATPEQMRQAESLMRDPNYIEAVLGSMNVVANLQAKHHGFPHEVKITGKIDTVQHR